MKMIRRYFLKMSGLGLIGAGVMGCTNEVKLPNILFILADDLSKHDVGCYGNTVIRTPNIDRIAEEGLRFNQACTPTAMCAPARNSLYTGLYPHRHGCHMNHGMTSSGVKTLPAYLQELGYRVGLSGKTHIQPESAFPFEYMNDEMQVVEQFMTKNTTPFCLIFASNEPHGPHETGGYDPEQVYVPPYQVDTPETRQSIANYYTDIDILDSETGALLDLLEKHHLAQSTVVFFAGDHGKDLFAKWTCYEAGLNVPFIVRWPERIEPSTVSDAMIGFIDFVPTAIELAGGEPPQDLDGRSILPVLLRQNETHHTYLFGAHTNRGIWSGETYPIRSVRNDRFKYIRNLYPEGTFTCIPTHGRDYNEAHAGAVFKSWLRKAATDPHAAERVVKLQKRPAEELYDLDHDPYELHNLAENPGYREVRLKLSRVLDGWMKQQSDSGLQAELKVPKKEPRQR